MNNSMTKITYIGQAGIMFEKNCVTVMIDPYLSDSVAETNPAAYRRVPVDESLFSVRPDIMIFTHCHADHYDPATASRFITRESRLTVLCPTSVWKTVRFPGSDNNFVEFNAGTRWTEGGFSFSAVPAEHSDRDAIGVVIDDGERKYYLTGDTLYSEKIFPCLPGGIFALFLPVNGAGNNMNMTDAAAFAERTGAAVTVPLHVGMLDDKTAVGFAPKTGRVVIPEIYKEIKL